MYIVQYRKFFLTLTALVILTSVGLIYRFGLNLGIDFTGGSVTAVTYNIVRPEVLEIKKSVDVLNIGGTTIQPAGEKDLVIRSRTLSEPEHQLLLKTLGPVSEKKFDSIGPTIGAELRTKSVWAVSLVILLIVLYVTFAFRKVSHPVSSWKYGLVVIVALLHDVIVPSGLYALYGHYTGAQVDVLFVTAILTILGFSVHDTIVVFDRIRENLRTGHTKTDFTETVGKSLNQTFVRSVNTSLSVMLVLAVLYMRGGESTKDFSLLLVAGIFFGTYSSIFLASPMLILIKEWQEKKLGSVKK